MGGRSSSLRPEVIQDLMNETEFSQTEIRDLYRQFMEDCRCKHGKRKTTMKMGQFKRIYSDIFPEGDSDKFAEHVFRTFDRDKTGKIDFREFVTSLSMTLKGTPEEKLSWAFDLYDIDNCGRVTRQEAETIVSVSDWQIHSPAVTTPIGTLVLGRANHALPDILCTEGTSI